MIDEARIEAAVEKIEQLDEFIAQSLDQDDREAFRGKWGDKISQIEPYKKGLYGDDWDEADNLFSVAKEQREGGMSDEEIDSALESYFLETAEKFSHLAEMASTPAEAAAAEEVAAAAMEGAETAAAAEGGAAAPEQAPGEPSEGEDPPEDFSWMDEEDPNEAMIAGHFGD
jgi:hypothetical protein